MRRYLSFLLCTLLLAASSAALADPPPVCSDSREFGRAGTASVVFFNFDEDPAYVNLAQATLPLQLAMQDYERAVLLADRSKLRHNPRALTAAQLVERPTRSALVEQVRELVRDGYAIDLWILAHGSESSFTAEGKDVRAPWLERQLSPERTGCERLPIRMVYQMSCWSSAFNPVWRKVGAQATMGSREVNFFPTELGRFARAWRRGETFTRALELSETGTPRAPVYAYLTADSLVRRGPWSACAPWSGVLGSDACSERYFTERWHTSWRGSGKRTMTYASKKLIAGDGGITRHTPISW